MKKQQFVLITSAYNEEKKIERTIQSLISQTVLPVQWIIISDGSTDATDNIIRKYSSKHPFITYHRISEKTKIDFAAKVNALNTGIEMLKKKKYDFIGILDADIELESGYYQSILQKFVDNPRLGVAGGNVLEYVNGKKNKRIKTFNSVAGAVQLFRRNCFEQTPGFLPLAYGGEDATVEIAARMNGWQVRTFPELEVLHHGYVGGGAGSYHKARFRRGLMYYQIGYHPLFHVSRCVYRLIEKPYITGTVAELFGYIRGKCVYGKPQIPAEIVEYLRKEQMQRLRTLKTC